MDAVLAAQGAPWAGRKMVCAESPTVTITATETEVTLKQSGLLAFDATYVLGAAPVEMPSKNGPTQDTLVFEDGKLILTKVNEAKSTTFVQTRTLTEGGMVLELKFGDIVATCDFKKN